MSKALRARCIELNCLTHAEVNDDSITLVAPDGFHFAETESATVTGFGRGANAHLLLDLTAGLEICDGLCGHEPLHPMHPCAWLRAHPEGAFREVMRDQFLERGFLA